MPSTLSISASDHRDEATVRLSDAVAALSGAVTRLNVPIVAWRFPVVRSLVVHDGAAFPVQRNGETTATTSKNSARGAFRMAHDCNLPGIGRFDATPVAALASGALDTQRPAAQA